MPQQNITKQKLTYCKWVCVLLPRLFFFSAAARKSSASQMAQQKTFPRNLKYLLYMTSTRSDLLQFPPQYLRTPPRFSTKDRRQNWDHRENGPPHKKRKPESSETPALTDQGKSQSLQPFSKSKPHRCFLRFKTTPPASRYPLSPNLNWEKEKGRRLVVQQQQQISTTTARTPPHPPPFVCFVLAAAAAKEERERERIKESVEEEEWCKAALLFARNAPPEHKQKRTDQNEKEWSKLGMKQGI